MPTPSEPWSPRDPAPPPIPLPPLPLPDPEPLGVQVRRLAVLGACLVVAPAWACGWLGVGTWTWGDHALVGPEWVLVCGVVPALVLLGAALTLAMPIWVAVERARVAGTDGWDRLEQRKQGYTAVLDRARAHTTRYGQAPAPRVQLRTQTVFKNAAGTTERVAVETRTMEGEQVIDGQTLPLDADDAGEEFEEAETRPWLLPAPATQPLPVLPPTAYTPAMQAIVSVGMRTTPSQRACIGSKAAGFPFSAGERDAYNLARDTLVAYGILRRTRVSVELAHGVVRDGDSYEAVHDRVRRVLETPGVGTGEKDGL